MVWSGATTTENEAMNFRKYSNSQKKIRTSVAFVGIDHFMMASIFVGYILISPSPITYPKYTKYYREKLHFLRLSSSWFFFKVLTPTSHVRSDPPR
jgi:hypothetical protein